MRSWSAILTTSTEVASCGRLKCWLSFSRGLTANSYGSVHRLCFPYYWPTSGCGSVFRSRGLDFSASGCASGYTADHKFYQRYEESPAFCFWSPPYWRNRLSLDFLYHVRLWSIRCCGPFARIFYLAPCIASSKAGSYPETSTSSADWSSLLFESE